MSDCPEDLIKFGIRLSKWLDGPARQFLPKSLYSWHEGGCWLIAQALHEWIGEESELMAVWDGDRHLVDHVVVQVGGCYLDSRGVRDEEELIDEALEEGVGDPYVRPFNPDAIYRMRCPATALRKLSQALVLEFGPTR